jgi:hypothetical protein
MKVFISWSGQTSKNIAEIFRQWIPSVIQVVKPYYSPDDITKGTRWGSEIAKELDESKVGIICLTKDNLQSPWIMFEAGALSKNIDNSKVCPIVFGVDPTDIQGPLIQFQAAKFTKEEVKKVIKMINTELNDSALSTEVFENVFEMWWPKLYEKIESELNKPINEIGKDLRAERDILEEILTLTRGISIVRDRTLEKDDNISPEAISDLLYSWSNTVSAIIQNDHNALVDFSYQLSLPIRHIISRTEMPKSIRREYIEKIESIKLELDSLRIKTANKYTVEHRILSEDEK